MMILRPGRECIASGRERRSGGITESEKTESFHGYMAGLRTSIWKTDRKVEKMSKCFKREGNKIICRQGTENLLIEPWGNPIRLEFINGRGEPLLREINPEGALRKRAREYKPLKGDQYRLKVSFVSDPEEKIYGMGQYQQEKMNLKGCNLELSHRNSQASVPFYISSLGYGFFWNNPGVGEVHFGSNTTEWVAESTAQMDY